LIGESGEFRSVDVAIVRGDGVVLHRGANPASVPYLVAKLFEWGRESLAHPLIKSSAVHVMLEHIHPFRDGNGRIGRLWQMLVLSKWNPIFAWTPIETLVHFNQALYYKALQDSHNGSVDCRPFIDYMLNMIENSMYKFIDVATETVTVDADPENDPENDLEKLMLTLMARYPQITYEKLAKAIDKSTSYVKRRIQALKQQGKIIRAGADKGGHWEVTRR
jgi:Fic family protein